MEKKTQNVYKIRTEPENKNQCKLILEIKHNKLESGTNQNHQNAMLSVELLYLEHCSYYNNNNTVQLTKCSLSRMSPLFSYILQAQLCR